jgi:hypothetical protein
MPKINEYININNKKSAETVYELKEENQIPTFEEFMKTYENDISVIKSYEREMESYNNVGTKKVGGPMYHGGSNSGNQFSIEYKFDHGGRNEKLFFEVSGRYTNVWNISGNLWKLRDELRKLENGEVKVFNLVQGNYRRDWDEEEIIKKCLRGDIRKCEEMRVELGVVHCMSQSFAKGKII